MSRKLAKGKSSEIRAEQQIYLIAMPYEQKNSPTASSSEISAEQQIYLITMPYEQKLAKGKFK